MNYATIKEYDIANGLGVRISLFVSGCTHHCKDCFNEVAWDFNYGTPFTKETEDYILNFLDNGYISGLSLLGGEPFEVKNQEGLISLVKRCKEKYPNKTIWCYTGYLFDEDLLKPSRITTDYTYELLSYIDVLIDGEFMAPLKDISLKFRGSSNQRIIDVKESLKTGKVVLIATLMNA